MQLLTATARVLLAQLQDPLKNVGRCLWLADIPGPAAAGFETAHTELTVASNPSANGVGTEPEVTASQTCVAAVLFVPVHH